MLSQKPFRGFDLKRLRVKLMSLKSPGWSPGVALTRSGMLARLPDSPDAHILHVESEDNYSISLPLRLLWGRNTCKTLVQCWQHAINGCCCNNKSNPFQNQKQCKEKLNNNRRSCNNCYWRALHRCMNFLKYQFLICRYVNGSIIEMMVC